MTQEAPSSIAPMLLTFIAGAALGAVVVAFTTPRNGPELRHAFKALGRRARRKVGTLAEEAGATLDDLKGRTACAAAHLKAGVARAIRDLRHEHLVPVPVETRTPPQAGEHYAKY